MAEVIVRIGLNLQRGQRLLIAEPDELPGVAPGAAPLVEAITRAAPAAGARSVEVIWGEGARLRRFAENKDWRGFVAPTGANAAMMHDQVQSHDALLDENAANHVALDEACAFTARRPEAPWLNRSLIHLDLPLAARPAFST